MRNPTTSITDLVKQVALEVATIVVEDKLDKFNLDNNLRNASVEFVELSKSIDSARPNSGDLWSAAEEELLNSELDAAIRLIAKKHGRGQAGIIARIKKLGLI